jgi:Zn finger protein HypA/HybF involved in hydrogenase expression
MSTAYTDLVNVPSFGKKRENNFNPERGDIGFFCRDCWKQVEAIHLEPQKIGKQVREYLYECPICHGKRIAIGTIEGLKEHYDRKK